MKTEQRYRKNLNIRWTKYGQQIQQNAKSTQQWNKIFLTNVTEKTGEVYKIK